MKKIVFITLLQLSSLVYAKECNWIHFKNDVGINEVSATLRANYLLADKILSNPFRVRVCAEIKRDLGDSVVAINSSESMVTPVQFYSSFGFTEEERDIWTKRFLIAVPTIVVLYGGALWDWGQDGLKFGFGNEGWFDKNSYSGGADKVGHMMSLYIDKRVVTWLALQAGHDFRSAQNIGLLTSGFIGLAFEVGDAISKYRFSMEDLFMDTVGIGFAWILDEYPSIDELIGLRWEWWPSHEYRNPDFKDRGDISSDYSGQKIYLSLKSAGVPYINESLWTRYFTLDFGFFTRGYEPDLTPDDKLDNNRHRYYSVGVGINLGSLIWESNPKSPYVRTAGSITKYWIPPNVTHSFVRKEL